MRAQKTTDKKIVLFVDDELNEAQRNKPITLAKLTDLEKNVKKRKRILYKTLRKTKELSIKYGFELKIFLDKKSTEDFIEKHSKEIVMAIVDLYIPNDADKIFKVYNNDEYGYDLIKNIIDSCRGNLKVISVLTVAKRINTDIQNKMVQNNIKYVELLKSFPIKELEKRLEKGFREASKGTRNRYCIFSGGDHVCKREYSARKEKSVFFMYPDNPVISDAIMELEQNKEKYFKKDLDDLEFINWKCTPSYTNPNLFCEICDKIEGTSLAIALKDSDCNANVMFEIGFAKGLGKKIKIVRFKDTEEERCPFGAGIEDKLEISMRDLDGSESLAKQLAGVIKKLPEEYDAKIIDVPEGKRKNKILIVHANAKKGDCKKIGDILREKLSASIKTKCKSIIPTELAKFGDTMKDILQYNRIVFCVHESPEVDNKVIYEYIGYAVARSRNVLVVMMDENMDKPSDVKKIAFTFQSTKQGETFVNKLKEDWHCDENN